MDDQIELIEFASRLLEKSDSKRKGAYEALKDELREGDAVFTALHQHGESGDAVKYTQLFNVIDVIDLLVQTGISEHVTGSILEKVAVVIAKTWVRLRKITVRLDKNQFKILLAIRRGFTRYESISKEVQLEARLVEEICLAMSEMKSGDFSLISILDGGEIAINV